MLKEMAEELERAQAKIKELELLVAVRVPRRDYDAIVKSMSVCQNTIERLMLALFKVKPNHPEVGDARDILQYLEHLIQNNDPMQDEVWVAREKARVEALKAQRMKRPAEMLGERIAFENSFEERALNRKKVFGKVKKEHKP
jgi:hypothetical protein